MEYFYDAKIIKKYTDNKYKVIITDYMKDELYKSSNNLLVNICKKTGGTIFTYNSLEYEVDIYNYKLYVYKIKKICNISKKIVTKDDIYIISSVYINNKYTFFQSTNNNNKQCPLFIHPSYSNHFFVSTLEDSADTKKIVMEKILKNFPADAYNIPHLIYSYLGGIGNLKDTVNIDDFSKENLPKLKEFNTNIISKYIIKELYLLGYIQLCFKHPDDPNILCILNDSYDFDIRTIKNIIEKEIKQIFI